MGTRTLLGAADVTDEHLARMVADLLRVDSARAVRRPRRGGRLRHPGHHHRVPALGVRHRDHRQRHRAVADLRQAHPGLAAAPDLPARARGVPRDGRAGVPVAHRGRGLPLRPRRAAAGRPDDAARRSTSSTSTSCRPRLDRGRRRPRRRRGTSSATGGRRTSSAARGEPGRRTARRPARRRVEPGRLRLRPAAGPGRPDADVRGHLAAPALRRLRRGAARADARRRRPGRGARRRGRRAPLAQQPRRRLPEQPARRRLRTTSC